MKWENYHDEATPETGMPFLVGYRKFVIAVIWLGLAVFTVLWCMFTKPTPGQTSVALWVVGSAGFFCSMFVAGNAAEWVKFWGVKTETSLTQKEMTQNVNESYDPNEHAAWKEAEAKHLSK